MSVSKLKKRRDNVSMKLGACVVMFVYAKVGVRTFVVLSVCMCVCANA